MAELKKRSKLSSIEVIKLSLRYFGVLSKLKTQFILTVILATLSKNYIHSQIEHVKLSIKNVADTQEYLKGMFLKVSLFNSLWAGMNFLTDFVFEKQLTMYGGYIATKVLKSVLFTDARITNETPGGEFEYYVTEGGKALAKISRFIIFAFLSKAAHFVFGFYTIVKTDLSQGKVATKFYMVTLGLITMIKIMKLKKVAYFNKLSMDLAFDKEKNITETLSNIAVIKSAKAEDHAVVRYGRASYIWENANISFKFWSLSTDLIYNLLSSTIRPGTALIMLLMANPSNTIDNSDITIFMRNLFEMLTTLNAVIKIFSDMQQAIENTHDLIHYMDLCRKELSKKTTVDTFDQKIEIKDLVYSVRDKLIFSGVDFNICKGEKIALFGKNGSGKSSIFKLILGFDDYKGSITLDGRDISTISMPSFRDLVTYVPQDTRLFDETIFYNLTFGNNKSYKEVIEECQRMKIHDIIMTFPNGYNTDVGECGKNLNGGLRQKIFYTRAFLNDAQIYMFDEPTNNLDSNHSQFLLEYLNDPKYTDKTFFVICHDLAIVRKFPKILHFTDGKIKTLETI